MKKMIVVCLMLTGCGAQFAFTPVQPVKKEEVVQLANEVQTILQSLNSRVAALEAKNQPAKK